MTITIHRGDKGTIFRGTITNPAGDPIDVSAANSALFRFQKPVGGNVDHAATLAGGNVIELVAPSGLLDESGAWRVQGFVAMTAGTDEFWTSILPFAVADQLAAPPP